MISFAVRRLILSVAVALTIVLFAFLMLNMAGDPAAAIAGPSATSQEIENLRVALGLDRPIAQRFIEWLVNALRGDLGDSFFFRRPVVDVIAERLPVTITLAVSSLTFAVSLSLPLGVLAAVKKYGFFDYLAQGVALIGQAIPSFWLGLLLVAFFTLYFPVLPASGSDDWRGMVLPSVVLGFVAVPAILRLTRSGMIDVLSSDYIRTARAKGLLWRRIVWRHALPNAIIPVVSIAAVQLGFMLTGSIVIETVFALNGTGSLTYESIRRGDLPTVQAMLMIFSVFYVAATFFSDVINAYLDPRIRLK